MAHGLHANLQVAQSIARICHEQGKLAASSFVGGERLPLTRLFVPDVRPAHDLRKGHPTFATPAAVKESSIPLTTPRQKFSKSSKGAEQPELDEKEAHKYFDQAVISVRSGDGGNGGVFRMVPKDKSKGKKGSKVGAPKKTPTGAIVLPVGGYGGDVILFADEGMETLLDLHSKKKYQAKKGGNVDTSYGLTSRLRDGTPAPPLKIPVPVGTVVKRKRGAKLIADLNRPGAEVCVASGGAGGGSLIEDPKERLRDGDVVSSADHKALVAGAPGEDINLELTLRIVADVGLVGLPNAGKSSLLAAVTAAKPDIAAYPFTTLIPNLGKISGDPDSVDGGYASGATMADLPGLIEGAHTGRGLGRMFLRHLRRTRLLVHVVDAAAPDPLADYRILREELRMYNPDYLQRPHIVVLNKVDLPEAVEQLAELREEILQGDPEQVPGDASEEQQKQKPSVPLAVVGVSAKESLHVEVFLNEVRKALAVDAEKPYLQDERREERRRSSVGSTWSL